MQEYAGEIKGGKFYFDRRKAFDAWCAGQKEKARFIFRIVKESVGRELSQNNAHWERCTILGDCLGLTKEQVSEVLMEDAYHMTRNIAYGEHKPFVVRLNVPGPNGEVYGVGERFFANSTSGLTKDAFWKLKEAAYNRLQRHNEDLNPEAWTPFPERGENGVILRMCYTWSERPEDRVPP